MTGVCHNHLLTVHPYKYNVMHHHKEIQKHSAIEYENTAICNPRKLPACSTCLLKADTHVSLGTELGKTKVLFIPVYNMGELFQTKEAKPDSTEPLAGHKGLNPEENFH